MADPFPCWSCGKPAVSEAVFVGRIAYCPDVNCPGHMGGPIELWNRRAPDPRLAVLVQLAFLWRNRGVSVRWENEFAVACDRLRLEAPGILAACGVEVKRG